MFEFPNISATVGNTAFLSKLICDNEYCLTLRLDRFILHSSRNILLQKKRLDVTRLEALNSF
jgi:hypothetical protein